MKQKLISFSLAVAGFALLAGCGSGGGISPNAPKDTLLESEKCIGCHEGTDANHSNWKTPGSGKPIVAEWKASTHNSRTNGASCQDCHGSGYLHPVSCNKCHSAGGAGSNPIPNPDDKDKCAGCHAKVNPRLSLGKPDGFNRLRYTDAKIPADSTTAYTHFSTGRHGNYVSTNYKRNCRKCHNPHDTSFGKTQREDWAQSGHGSTVSGFITGSTDFKTRGSRITADKNFGPFCVRCHTSTGYVNFVTSDFMDVQALPDLGVPVVRNNYPELPRTTYTDKSREAINCNVCHSDGRANDESAYSGKLRQLAAPNIYFNFSAVTNTSTKLITNVQYQDHYSSNICFPCHAGRGVGLLIKKLKDAGNDFTNVNSPGAHDFSGAGMLTANVGYGFGKVYTASTHDTIGSSSGKGPCITCHMNKASETHSFMPVNHDSATFPLYTTNRKWAQVYSVSVTSPAAFKIAALTSLSCNTSGCHSTRTAENLNAAKEGYISALAALNKWVRLVRSVPINPSDSIDPSKYVYTYKASTKTGTLTYSDARLITNWTYLGAETGPDLMGAVFNLSMLNNEPGAYVHNSLYARRIVYDSLYFLCTTSTYPAVQANVADAIFYLITTSARTLETSTTLYAPVNVNQTNKLYLLEEVRATIPTQQALNAIQWLYGKPYASLTPAEKLIRPGGI